MFKKLNKSYGVQSKEGYSVERLGSPITQFEIKYTEGEHALLYPLENLMPGSTTDIDVNKIGPWLPPYNSEEIAYERKEIIAKRICDAMNFSGDSFEIISFRA